MIFYFYFNPRRSHHSWLTLSGNKGPGRDAPRSFVAVDERFSLSSVRASLSQADASATLKMCCFLQGYSLVSPFLPNPVAAIGLPLSLHCAFQYYSFNGLNDFSTPET